jgi:hypothetical protein
MVVVGVHLGVAVKLRPLPLRTPSEFGPEGQFD